MVALNSTHEPQTVPTSTSAEQRSVPLASSPIASSPTFCISPASTAKSFPPKITTFVLPPGRTELPSSAKLSPPTSSILTRLGRRLSQSKNQLVRRVSLGSKDSRGVVLVAGPSTASSNLRSAISLGGARTQPLLQSKGPESKERPRLDSIGATFNVPLDGEQGGEKMGLRRGTKRLGRSKSEAVGGGRKLISPEMESALGWNPSRREGSEHQSRLFWEERLGVCWDGREQVHPDLPSDFVYSSNSDFIAPPAHIVYASTLSTFAPRPPLRSRLSQPPSPPAKLSPAAQVREDYLMACRDKEILLGGDLSQEVDLAGEGDTSTPTFTSSSQSITPVPTATKPYATSLASNISRDSSRSSTREGRDSEERFRDGRESNESDTSLESMNQGNGGSNRVDKEGYALRKLKSVSKKGVEVGAESKRVIYTLTDGPVPQA